MSSGVRIRVTSSIYSYPFTCAGGGIGCWRPGRQEIPVGHARSPAATSERRCRPPGAFGLRHCVPLGQLVPPRLIRPSTGPFPTASSCFQPAVACAQQVGVRPDDPTSRVCPERDHATVGAQKEALQTLIKHDKRCVIATTACAHMKATSCCGGLSGAAVRPCALRRRTTCRGPCWNAVRMDAC